MADFSSPKKVITQLGGNDLKEMFKASLILLEHNTPLINRLNVFPVPDGDTGTNMTLTLREMMKMVGEVDSNSAKDISRIMARGAMMASRGNSGLITSQLFKGMAEAFGDKLEVGVEDLALAFRLGSEYAYSVLAKPVEGTILTVFKSVSDAAQECLESECDIRDLLNRVCEAAWDAVAQTPDLLPRLREAGVVDAGGLGLSIILDGIRLHLSGGDLDSYEVRLPDVAGVPMADVLEGFLTDTQDDVYGNCTQFVILGEALDLEQLRIRMERMARSTVVVGDDSMAKVHVHTEAPEDVLSYARTLGDVSQVSISDMDEQHQEFSASQRIPLDVREGERAALTTAVVAVAWGEGIERIFTEQGAEVLVAGDTMNPSVQEIVASVDNAPSQDVVFLPNNKNIIPAAQQAKEFTEKNLEVMPTTSIPQGISALLEYIPDKDIRQNLSDMENAISSVKTAEVCEAVRSVNLDGVNAQEGQIIGLLERELVVSGDNPAEVLLALLSESDAEDAELITLYWGGPLSQDAAESTLHEVQEAFPDAEVELVQGGQPHYHFIASIE